jgi:fructokinase
MMTKKIVGLGEVLWDLFPDRACLGGAPANFAYITALMGDQGIVASRVGDDPRGHESLQKLRAFELDVNHVQSDPAHATGTVNVEVDDRGMARYEISHPVAWDFLEWTTDWQWLAETADAVCFGSLAQRSEISRKTILNFVRAATKAVKIFDVNLRQSYYSQDVLDESMKLADIVKLNDEELPKVMSLNQLPHRLPHEDERSSAQRLIEIYDLKLVCVTRGGLGSLLVTSNETREHGGFHVKVADTVGSGDAFTAGLVHEYLRNASFDQMNETANRVGAWVASEAGGMPLPRDGKLENSLAQIR